MTVLSPAPVTAMGLPLSSGLSRCSTEAKKASMSTHRMIFAMPLIIPGLSGENNRTEIHETTMGSFTMGIRMSLEIDEREQK